MSAESVKNGRASGTVAIVTGAASGIGRATATLLARHGASVVVADIRADRGEAAVAELTGEGLAAHFIKTDVSRREDVERLVAGSIERFGRLDTVVNDAAVFVFRSVEESTEEEWDQVIDTNLKSVYLVSHEAIPHLRASGGGAIVNISSVHAFATMPRVAAYAASKGAVLALTRQMAIDLTKDRIRVNAVVVGGVDTEMSRKHFALRGQTPEEAGFLGNDRVIGHIANPEEIASAVLFLVTRDSSFVNGSSLVVDGGLLALQPAIGGDAE